MIVLRPDEDHPELEVLRCPAGAARVRRRERGEQPAASATSAKRRLVLAIAVSLRSGLAARRPDPPTLRDSASPLPNPVAFGVMEQCEVCGFAWETVDRDEIGPRVDAGTAEIAASIVADPDRSAMRPSAQRWSATQYAAHVRDVLLTLRDRLVIGVVEDNPSFKPMYRDERVDLGLYDADPRRRSRRRVAVGDGDVHPPVRGHRPGTPRAPVQYGVPSPVERSLLWMGQQAVHEVEHHRSDIVENLAGT